MTRKQRPLSWRDSIERQPSELEAPSCSRMSDTTLLDDDNPDGRRKMLARLLRAACCWPLPLWSRSSGLPGVSTKNRRLEFRYSVLRYWTSVEAFMNSTFERARVRTNKKRRSHQFPSLLVECIHAKKRGGRKLPSKQ